MGVDSIGRLANPLQTAPVRVHYINFVAAIIMGLVINIAGRSKGDLFAVRRPNRITIKTVRESLAVKVTAIVGKLAFGNAVRFDCPDVSPIAK